MARVWLMILCEFIVATRLCCAVVSAQQAQSIHESAATSTASSAKASIFKMEFLDSKNSDRIYR